LCASLFIITRMKKRLSILLTLLLLAACGQGTPSAVLPTELVLPTLTPTLSPTATRTGTQTATYTATPTPTASLTPTVSVTPSTTITDTPTSTPTITPSPSPSVGALGLLAQLAANATPIPQTLLPALTQPPAITLSPAPGTPIVCASQPTGGLATAYNSDPTLNLLIGCPQGTPVSINSAVQQFERGSMVWLQGPIYVLYASGRFQRFEDTYAAGVDPESGGEIPPVGLIEPVRGFGKIWRTNPDVRNGLGWGIAPEAGNQATQQRFDRGWMVYLPQRGDIVVLIEEANGTSGTWRAVAGSF
jgi:hypothetical protein